MWVWVADPTVLLVPGTPLLLTGIDVGEPEEMTTLRSVVHRELVRFPTWAVPIPGPVRPPVVSLGGLGLAVGARIPAAGPAQPTNLLRGDALITAVKDLDEDAVRAARQIPTGVLVAILTALEAGVGVHTTVMGDGHAPPSDVPSLVPLDFSGAAHPDAPLAPRDGAAAFDRELERALTGSVDHRKVAGLQARASECAAWIDMLSTVDLAGARGARLAAADVHHVRYRVLALEAEALPGTGGPQPPSAAEGSS